MCSVQASQDPQLRSRSVLPRRRVPGPADGRSALAVRPAVEGPGRRRLAASAVADAREARRDRQERCAGRPRGGARPEGLPARPGLDRGPLQPRAAAGPVRLLDRTSRTCASRWSMPGRCASSTTTSRSIVRSPLAAQVLDICTVERNHVGVLFHDGEYVETLPPGQYAFWRNVGRRQGGRGRPARGDDRRRRPGDHDGRQGHAADERRGHLPRRRCPAGRDGL